MSAALWLDVDADIESMVRHFRKAEEFYKREQRPAGADWHSALIRRLSRPLVDELARPALLSAELAAAMQIARSFRHCAIQVYDDFNIDRFPPALEAVQTIVEELPKQIAAFRKVMDG